MAAGPMQQPRTTQEQRIQEAQPLLQQRLQSAGYSPAEAAEILRLAQRLYSIGGRPQGALIDGGNSLHRRINAQDVLAVRDKFMEVARNPKVPVRQIIIAEAEVPTVRPGQPRERELQRFARLTLKGPDIGLSMTQLPEVAPVRTYSYSVAVRDRMGRASSFEISMNKNLRNLGEGRNLTERLHSFLRSSDSSSVVLGVTSGGRQVSLDDFRSAYFTAYSDTSILNSNASIDIVGSNRR